MFYVVGDIVELTSKSSDTLTITLNRDMRITKIAFDATGIFKIVGSDIQGAPNVLAATASYPILGRALSDGGRPLTLDEPLDLGRGSSITIKVTDLSEADNKVGVAFIGTAAE